LSNRHASKQEEIRLQQEKANRNTQIIEEVYQTLIKIDDLCDAFAYDVINGSTRPGEGILVVKRIKVIRETSERLKTLINLYLRSLKEDLDTYITQLANYWNAIGRAYMPGFGAETSKGKRAEELKAPETDYKENLRSLQGKLEDMLK
jgi:hypothetical protein